MGEKWRYSWVGELLDGVWWLANIGATITVAVWVPWIALQLLSLLAILFLWEHGSQYIQRKLPFPQDKAGFLALMLLCVGLAAIGVVQLNK
ncbi:MAG: hypothetical protein K8U57_21085 [Planctomycetes bacterium]|nr:hypothetical protein [Planctomycetota bacterium]